MLFMFDVTFSTNIMQDVSSLAIGESKCLFVHCIQQVLSKVPTLSCFKVLKCVEFVRMREFDIRTASYNYRKFTFAFSNGMVAFYSTLR